MILTRIPKEFQLTRYNMPTKFLKDKEYLTKLYCQDKKSVRQIAEECSINMNTIYGWLHKFGIIARRNGPQRKTVVVNCSYCEKPLMRRPSTVNIKNFCNYLCYHSWMIGRWAVGENNKNWKGGISLFCSDDLKNGDWRSIRLGVLKRFPFCVICGNREKRMNIHHIIPRKTNSSLTYDLDNLVTLCHPCHASIKGKEGQWEAYFTRLICKIGELQETLNAKAHGNPQPSPSNAKIVDGKVQRLMGEDSQTNNPNTSADLERDEIVRAYAKA